MELSTELARFNMIEQQIRPWEVLDRRVLHLMGSIPRELFVPEAYRNLAYADVEIPIGSGQTMLAPRIVGRMLQALAVRSQEKVLEIGAGTGYLTACLARLGANLVSLELRPELLEAARRNLAAMGAPSAEIRQGDGLAVIPDESPFDAIAITGSLPSEELLPRLQMQLRVGGRLFVVVGEDPLMEALLITRVSETGYSREALFETSIPTLDNAPEPRRFQF